MKALTLWQPWAWAICHAGKRIENRPWAPWPSVVGRDVAIHAGRTYRREDADDIEAIFDVSVPPRSEIALGAVVAVARVTGHVTESEDEWFSGPFGWTLADVRVLPVPVPCKGALGLWSLPPDVERAVLAQLATEGDAA